MFSVQLGFVSVGMGLLAYFIWRPKGGEAIGPWARGSVGGGLVIIGLGVALILGGLVSLLIK